MKKALLLYFFSAWILCLEAQNTPVLSNYMFNKAVYNPASIGRDDALDITALYRNQWTGLKGNPSLITFSVHSPLTVANSNMGIYVLNEMQGAERATHIMLSYAYRHPFKFGNLAVGLSGGMIQKSLDGSVLRSPEGNYENGVEHNDQYIPSQSVSGVAPNLSIGVYYDRRNFFTGISVNHLLESEVKLETPTQQTSIKFTRQLVFMGGYQWDINRKLNFQTHVLLRSDFTKVQTDISAIIEYKNNIYGGFSFRGITNRTKESIIAMIGFKLFKKLQIGYSYDYSLSSLNNANSGSHEVFVKYQLRIKDLLSPGKIIYNPRFL